MSPAVKCSTRPPPRPRNTPVGLFCSSRFRYLSSSATMPPRPGARRAQPSTSGLGRHFASPKRPRDKNKTCRLVSIPGQSARHQRNLARLEELLNMNRPGSQQLERLDTSSQPAVSTTQMQDDVNFLMHEMDESDHLSRYDHAQEPLDTDKFQPPCQTSTGTSRYTQAERAQRLYAKWKELLPLLVVPYVQYTARTLGKPLEVFNNHISFCQSADCEPKQSRILCLMFDREANLLALG
ncbi:hypothetical protein J3R83DRAFT_5484 [Lanmaoa asiatica]|nr:hypothetical protein J3R83DRAFT_5484 [Lanmaoa asiatica]